jgi:excinuclease ABC subunit A
VRGKKGEHKDVIEKMRADGHVRARIDGEIRSLDDEIDLKKSYKHSLEAVVDRLVAGGASTTRLADSVERSLKCGEDGLLILLTESGEGEWDEELISEHLACTSCKISFGALVPRNFSFNSPYGACSTCHGLGSLDVIDEEMIVVPSKPVGGGAFPLLRKGPRRVIMYYNKLLKCLADHYEFPLEMPFGDLPEPLQYILIHGSGDEQITFKYRFGRRQHNVTKPFEGIGPNLTRRYHETDSVTLRERLKKVMVRRICPDCEGARLRPASLSVTVGGMPIHTFVRLSVNKALDFITNLELEGEEAIIAAEIVREIRSRLGFLEAVGLGYLTLDRHSGTLSGGEAQRIRLATQVGSGLVGVLYILDEPSIGLHQRDNQRLLNTLNRLRDIGNTVIVVEHDLDTILAADHIVDLGPGAGAHGGMVVASGDVDQIRASAESLTGRYLSGEYEISIPGKRQKGMGNNLKITGGAENNLKNLNVDIPLGTFCCVTGVSGSGKSMLINSILVRALNRHFKVGRKVPGKHKKITGMEHIDKMIVIDQSPIGRTPRSNAATYTGAFDIIRTLFSQLPESKVRGYKPGRFSFNVKGGRCEDCKGDGIKKIEMQFLPDVYVNCETCNGQRYNRETLTITYAGRNIAQVLNMTVAEACEVFDAHKKLGKILRTLNQVGLGYIHLGQPATTLSGGEAQRVKLASELARPQRGHTLYVLDEPTTGLHMNDINKLLEVLISLRDENNTVLVIEHNLDVIKVADHIIDLGPEGGDAGGRLVSCGTPEKVADCQDSYTGQYLRPILYPDADE